MTEEEIADITLAEAWAGENGFDSDCNNINSVEANGELVNAFLAGLKAGRPEWHKIADGDLPKKVDVYITNIGVLTYDNYGNGVYKWHTPYCEACDYADEVCDDEVIAWCEIPTFEE